MKPTHWHITIVVFAAILAALALPAVVAASTPEEVVEVLVFAAVACALVLAFAWWRHQRAR